MESSEIFDQLTAIFRDVLDDENLTLTPQMTAADVAQWDSVNHIDILVACEMRFGIKFRTAEIDQLQNVGEFVELIDHKLNASSH